MKYPHERDNSPKAKILRNQFYNNIFICRALHQRGNDIRAKVSIIKVDQELFTSGKVNEMKARLAERRTKINCERSDGITEDDDDEDVVY